MSRLSKRIKKRSSRRKYSHRKRSSRRRSFGKCIAKVDTNSENMFFSNYNHNRKIKGLKPISKDDWRKQGCPLKTVNPETAVKSIIKNNCESIKGDKARKMYLTNINQRRQRRKQNPLTMEQWINGGCLVGK